MEIEYIPDDGFKNAVVEGKAVLTNVDGHMRWVITRADGSQYALRPESAKDDKQQ